MSTFRTAGGASIERDQVVEALAAASHETWIRQKVRDQGANEDTLSREVAEHDIERAEDAVATLEQLGVLFRSA